MRYRFIGESDIRFPVILIREALEFMGALDSRNERRLEFMGV